MHYGIILVPNMYIFQTRNYTHGSFLVPMQDQDGDIFARAGMEYSSKYKRAFLKHSLLPG